MGCTLSVKIHPSNGEKPLSPYNRLLRTLQSPRMFQKRHRGNLEVAPDTRPSREPSVHTLPPRACGALFIGIDSYKHWPSLSCAVRDATSMAHQFMALGYRTTLLTDEDATCAAIQKALEECAKTYDVFVVGMYGHGMAPPSIGGMFVPVNATTEKTSYDKIHANQLKTISERTRATSAVFILDFCYSGAFLVDERRMRGSSWEDMLEKERSRIVITSGLSAQRVDDSDGSGNSPFTSAMLTTIEETPNAGSVLQLYLSVRDKLTERPDVAIPKIGRYPGDGGGDVFLKRKSFST